MPHVHIAQEGHIKRSFLWSQGSSIVVLTTPNKGSIGSAILLTFGEKYS